MIRRFIPLLALLVACTTTAFAQRNCGSMDHLQQEILQDPSRLDRLDQLEKFTERYLESGDKEVNGSIITIPVIVHVVYRTSQENISDAQINSQIQVLNDDFRRLNNDRNQTPGDFLPVAADSEIEFCLTQVIRKQTTVNGFGTNDAVKRASSGGSNVVTPESAMNVWVCNIGGSILGYAQFPGGSAATDGVVNDYRYFGTTGTATAPFNLGRTMTHEVGHYLNLRHIWGDGGCRVDDFVSDTPTAGGPNYTGGSCSYPGPNSCTPRRNSNEPDFPDMFQNYMDYSDDGCMNLFTLGQKDRMRAAIQGSRPGLLSATCDGNPPNPTAEICDNGIDDDLDGLIDCADPDCGSDPVCDDGGGGGGGCDAPTGLSASSRKGGKEVTFRWNAVSGASSYAIEVYVGGTLIASNAAVSGTSASLTGTSRGTRYDWQVRANCGSVSSDWASSSVTARQTARVSATTEGLWLVPNPSSADEVTLNYDLGGLVAGGQPTFAAPSAEEAVTVRVLTMTGRQLSSRVLTGIAGTATLDVRGLTAGVYLVQVVNAAGDLATTKLVKL